MPSVADDLRRERLEAQNRLSASQRVALAFELGESDLETFALAQGMDPSEARRILRRRRQLGRRPCSLFEEPSY